MLSCGNHRCEQRDHKGACPRCLRSSFEGVSFPLVITYLSFLIKSQFLWAHGLRTSNFMWNEHRLPLSVSSAPSAMYPSTLHSCHFDDVACPPCPFLAAKQCACRKRIVPNTRCSLETEKVCCGTVCGKYVPIGVFTCHLLKTTFLRPMACGFQHCEVPVPRRRVRGLYRTLW